jgi:hypothetical protein
MKNNRTLFHTSILLLLTISVISSCTFEFINPPPTTRVAFKSIHGRYITAMGAEDNWMLWQEEKLGECGWFTQHRLANGKIALESCYGRYITAPHSGATRWDWLLKQESKLDNCGQFDLYELGNDEVAFKTCANKFFTAGDGNWDSGLEWSIVAETEIMKTWEIFTTR